MEKLYITETNKQNTLSSLKWMKFMTIYFAIVVMLIAVSGIFIVLVSQNNGALMRIIGMVYIFTAVLFVYPIVKSFCLIKQVKIAFNTDSQESLDNSSKIHLSVMRYVGIITIISFIIPIVYAIVFSIISPNEDTWLKSENIEQSISMVENTEDSSYDASDDILDIWQGNYEIEGQIVRVCSVNTILHIEKSSEGNYVGNVSVSLGERDERGGFSADQGLLYGKIRAKITEDNKLLVTLVECSTEDGCSGNLFETINEEKFKKGDQIFLITKEGDKYDAMPIGKLESYFDYGLETKKLLVEH